MEKLFDPKIIVVIAVGSIDGILTTSAFMNFIEDNSVPIIFTQPFLVDKINPSEWEKERQVVLIDLAVDNSSGSTKTADFISQIKSAGHKVVAIIDEHDDKAWAKVWGRFDDLKIWPVTKIENEEILKSSGAVLSRFLRRRQKEGLSINDLIFKLCEFADKADQQIFEGIGEIVNKAIKPAIWDNSRREYLTRHFALHVEPDEKIKGWLAEYQQMEVNHSAIIAEKAELGNGIWRISSLGKLADATTLFALCYSGGARIVVLENIMFNKTAGKKTPMVSIATSDRSLNILSILQEADIPCSGFAQKANLELEYADIAIKVIGAFLVS